MGILGGAAGTALAQWLFPGSDIAKTIAGGLGGALIPFEKGGLVKQKPKQKPKKTNKKKTTNKKKEKKNK